MTPTPWWRLVGLVVLAEAVMVGFGPILGSPAGFLWGAVAGGLAVARVDDAYRRAMARRGSTT